MTNTTLSLSLPDRCNAAAPFLSSSAKTQEWLSNLPMAHKGETARLILQALKESNGQKVKPADRFRFLEQLTQPVQEIVESLAPRYRNQTLPLSSRARIIADLVREFHSEMALGYEIVVEDMATGRLSSLLYRQLMQNSIHRAISYFCRVLLDTYQIYTSPGKNIWHELHQLYRLAVEEGIQDKPLTPTGQASTDILDNFPTIGAAYKGILLLSLACPYRLRQGVADKIFAALQTWAPLCTLNLLEEGIKYRKGLFVVHADRDAAPSYLDLQPKNYQGVSWVLDTASLNQVLHTLIATARSQSKATRKNALSPSQLHRLMLAWGITWKRGTQRAPCKQRMQVAIGLSDLYAFLDDRHSNDQEEEQTSETVLTLSEVTSWAQQGKKAPMRTLSFCNVEDEGDTGCRLRWPHAATARAQVGDLIGLRPENSDTPGDWSIGVIRWLRTDNEAGLDIGVQILSHTAKAISFRMADNQDQYGEPIAAIHLQDTKKGQPLLSVITPHLIQRHAKLALNIHGKKQPVLLSSTLRSGASFDHYAYDEVEKEIPLILDRRQYSDNYSRLWSTI